MNRSVHALLVGSLIVAGSLLTTGAASASTAEAVTAAPASAVAVCTANTRSRNVPAQWIPRSPRESDRRLSWEQVRGYDRNHDDRLSDDELASFRNADRAIEHGGPRCGQPDNPPRR